jgi:sterol desaturase/sphingolipid hydroxylase (fatty acid hydroxylase superfamily)
MNEGLNPVVRTVSGLAVLVLLLAWESFAPFFAHFAGARGARARHAVRNWALSAINAVVTALLFTGLWLATAQWAQAHRFGLLHWLAWPGWARLVATFLLFDAWMYWWHRLNHRVPFLWRFHRTHHSDPKMDVTTASRFHFGEIGLSSVLRVPVIAVLGLQLWELAWYELAMFTVVMIHHANIALPARLDCGLRVIIVTPFMHKMHHSRWRPETDSNYSSLFSFWDRLFRSFSMRDDPHTLHFGLTEFDAPENHTLTGLLTTPLKQVARSGQSSSNTGANPNL